jgi:hypothetical protein
MVLNKPMLCGTQQNYGFYQPFESQKKSRIEHSNARAPKPTEAGNSAFNSRFSLSLKEITV